MRITKPIYIALVLLAVGCYDNHSERSGSAPLEAATTTIGSLRTLCNGQTVDITADVVIVGRVTATDTADNFHRSFFVEDSTGGIEIMAGNYQIHRKYPQGTALSVSLNGCRTAFSDGAMQIGLRPESYSSYEVAYFMSDVLLDKHIRRSDDRKEPTPILLAIASLDDSMCGRLVRIDGLQYSPADGADENSEPQMAGYNRFTDSAGNAVYTFVRDDADFADAPLPLGKTAVCGILLHGTIPDAGGQFIIKPRTSTDYETCDNPR